jgi:hypothetical protein
MNDVDGKFRSSKKIMYLGLGTASPSDKNIEYIPGVTYALLIFTLADDFENAKALAIEHMESTGWENVIIDKLNPVNGDAIKKAQPEVQTAYDLAVKDGSHAMVLDRGTRIV